MAFTDIWDEIEAQFEKCPLKNYLGTIMEVEVTAENVREFERTIKRVKTHEADLRMIRQELEKLTRHYHLGST